MFGRRTLALLRDIVACAVVGLFMFPLLWWGMTSFKPGVWNVDALTIFFKPTLENYEVTIFGQGDSIFDSRKSILDSIIVSLSSSLITVVTALPPAYAFSKMQFRHSKNLLYVILFQRFIPTITLVIPLVVAYHGIGMLDRKLGVSFAHAALNMPFAILLVKSFFDDIPKEVAEAAKIDGATEFQMFAKICVPLIKGGIVTTAILAFIFSWIEFMLALFLTFSVRLVPVQAAILASGVWGIAASLTTAALIPVFIFLMMAQKHLVRGMTLGLQK